MKSWILLFCFLIISPSTYAADKTPVIIVSGPTLVAFFAPVTQEEVDKDVETADALDDFQWHLREVKQKLEKAGISVHEIYARKFEVVTGKKRKIFKPAKIEVGYFFVKSGKSPKVEYGVMSNMGIVDAAENYFGLKQLSSEQ